MASPEPSDPPTADPATLSIPGESLTRRDVMWLLAACVPLFLALGQLQAVSAEGRSLGIALSMRTKGTWLTPDLFGEFWGFRPLLYFWCVAVTSFFTGGVTEFAGRFPAAVSGAATILMTGHLAARLLGRRVAVQAGWTLGTAYTWWVWSRMAGADTMNVAFATAALAVYVESIRGFRWWHAFAFATLVGLGSQAKGVPALILPCAIGFVDAVMNRRKDVLRAWPWLLAAAPVAAGFFAMSILLAHDPRYFHVWYIENIQRIYDPYDHHDAPWHYYFWILPLLFMPWGLALPSAVAWITRSVKKDRGRKFIATAAFVTLMLFTLSASRRSYYILPIFPWCALLVAAMYDSLERHRETTPRGWRLAAEVPLWTIFAVMIVAGAVLVAGPLLPGDPGRALAALPKSPVAGLLALGGAVYAWRGRDLHSLHFLVARSLIPILMFASWYGDQLRDRLYLERPFAIAVRQRLEPGKLVYFHGQNSKMFWNLGEAPDVSSDESIAMEVRKREGYALVVSDDEHAPLLEKNPFVTAHLVLKSAFPDLPYHRDKHGYRLYLVRLR